MKLRFLLSLSAAALLSLPVFTASALAEGPTGKIHGHVTTPVGIPQTSGIISLSTDQGHTLKFSFDLNANGDYTGDNIPVDTYSVILRFKDTPAGKLIDEIDNVKIVAGQDTLADVDMSRKEYIDKMSPEQKKQLEEIKKTNASALKTNAIVKTLTPDLLSARAAIKEGDGAHAAAVASVGAAGSKTDIAAKETEIKTTKYGEAETLMQKDTDLAKDKIQKQDEALIWVELGNAQSGLGKYDQAEVSFKKALELNASAGPKARAETEAAAHSGLGTLYTRTKKATEAAPEFDAAAKAAPAQASLYYSNFTKILYQMNSTGALSDPDAQAAAADKAIAATPTNTPAILYYLKAQALTQKASFDAKTQKITLPPGTAEAYSKYLELDPNGQFSEDAKSVLASAGQKVPTSFKAKK
jgi:tetratricopeptide (TPR) repeat protein